MSEPEHRSCSKPAERPRPLRSLVVVLILLALGATALLFLLMPLKGWDSGAYLARLKVGMPESEARAVLGSSWRETGGHPDGGNGVVWKTTTYEDMRLLRASRDWLVLESESLLDAPRLEVLATTEEDPPLVRATLVKGEPDTRSLLKRLVDWMPWKLDW